MKTIVGVEPFEQKSRRMLERARKLDAGISIPAERRLMFETAADMISCLTANRIELLQTVRLRPVTITDLAAALNRDRATVSRDVKALHAAGILKVKSTPNPGHGIQTLVQATAKKLQLQVSL